MLEQRGSPVGPRETFREVGHQSPVGRPSDDDMWGGLIERRKTKVRQLLLENTMAINGSMYIIASISCE